MRTYLGDAALAGLSTDPRGCYVGHGNIWLETSATTFAFKTTVLKNVDKTVKVPAKEFFSLFDHGVRNIQISDRVITVTTDHFRATLPSAEANHYCTDIKVADHEAITPSLAQCLIDHIASAVKVIDKDSANHGYRMIYAAESRVFATNGFTLYVGTLPARLHKQMIFDWHGSDELTKLWRHHVLIHAMQSTRSLLLKSKQSTCEIRCVDSVIPSRIYKAARSINVAVPIVQLERERLTNAVVCLGVASNFADYVHILVEGDAIHLTSNAGTASLERLNAIGETSFECNVQMRALCSVLVVLQSEAVLLQQARGMPGTISLYDPTTSTSLTVATKESI